MRLRYSKEAEIYFRTYNAEVEALYEKQKKMASSPEEEEEISAYNRALKEIIEDQVKEDIEKSLMQLSYLSRLKKYLKKLIR